MDVLLIFSSTAKVIYRSPSNHVDVIQLSLILPDLEQVILEDMLVSGLNKTLNFVLIFQYFEEPFIFFVHFVINIEHLEYFVVVIILLSCQKLVSMVVDFIYLIIILGSDKQAVFAHLSI